MSRTPSNLLFLCAAVSTAALTPSACLAATEAYHLNSANITLPSDPRATIDATAVYNRGTIDFSQNNTTKIWDTSNTRFFTNGPAGLFPGVMKGSIGFQFDFAPSFGPRQPSAVFNNLGSGSISSLQNSSGGPDYLLVNATNIFNQGTMASSAVGLLRLDGTNIDLSKGGLGVNPIVGQGTTTTPPSQTNPQGTFTPDVAVYDNYWALNGMGVDLTQNPFITVAGTNIGVASPQHNVTPQPATGPVTLSLVQPDSGFYDATNGGLVTITITNSALQPVDFKFPTNLIRQAVFVGGPDPTTLDTNFTVSFKLAPSSDVFNPMNTLMFELSNSATNVVDPTSPIQTTIVVKDTLASEPGFLFLAANDTPRVGTFRPGNYEVSRIEPGAWQNGSPLTPNLTNGLFFYDGAHDSNQVVSGIYSAYSFTVDNVSSGPIVPTLGFTNLPGRIEIHGDTANLSQLRLRAEGAAIINVDNLLSSSNAAVDCQNVSYVVGSRSGNLNFQNLVQPQLKRVNGTVALYSFLYQNTKFFYATNYNTNKPPANFNVITNGCLVDYSVLIADRTKLFSTRTVVLHNLQLNSANTTFSDAAAIEDAFTINGDSFTLLGLLTLTNGVPAGSLNDFGAINAPVLRNFTNFGTFLITNVAAFGTDTLRPYDSFYNRGRIGAYTIQVASGSFDTASNLDASGSINISAGSAVFNKGVNAAFGDFQIAAGTLNLNQAQIYAGGALVLTVTNSFSDNGAAAPNTLRMTNGLTMPIKPALGDLAGTTIDTIALQNQNALHLWAGADRGPNRSGFLNNVSIGKLVLRANALGGLLVFSPAGAQNAMYVNVIDLSNLADYQNQIRIDPGMTIYFLNSVGVPPAQLNGQFNGRMVWVTSNAVNSQPSLGTGMPPGLSLTWNAAPGGVYAVQSTTNLLAPVWQNILSYTNTAMVDGGVTVLVDPNAPAGNLQRYYRVNFVP
jgi:hypothetical protein